MLNQDSVSLHPLMTHYSQTRSPIWAHILYHKTPRSTSKQQTTTLKISSRSYSNMMRYPNLMRTQNVPRDPKRRQQRMLFAMFIKILLKYLAESDKEVLCQQVRSVISTCTKRNRMGDPNFWPLEDVLEAHLREMVGEAHWQRAKRLQRHYMERKKRSTSSPRRVPADQSQIFTTTPIIFSV